MPNYKEGKIYKIVCEEKKLIYYGSTTQGLDKRLRQHKNNKNRTINKNNMIDPKIYLVENYPCDSKYELLKRERFFIENNECINKDIPTRTNKEWTIDNKEALAEKKKQYRINNLVLIKEKQKQFYNNNRERLLKEKREYTKNNKEVLAEKNKKWREANKQLIAEKYKIKIICECGSEVTKQHMKRHQRTDKHKKLLETKNILS